MVKKKLIYDKSIDDDGFVAFYFWLVDDLNHPTDDEMDEVYYDLYELKYCGTYQ